MDRGQVEATLEKMRDTYRSLLLGSLELLALDSTYWTEKLLLRLINRLSRQRLKQIRTAFPDKLRGETASRLRENILEAQVAAALGGHQLGQWEKLEDEHKYQAVCSRCGKSIYASSDTIYSILEDDCQP